MKKKYLISLVILICFGLSITKVKAQKFYAEISSGYGLSMASQNLASKIDNGIAQTKNVLVRGSFGRGLIFGGLIGYRRNENISFELGASYLISNKYQGYYTKELDFNEKTILSASMFRLAPGIRLTVGEGKIKPYARVGIVVRIFGKITIKDSQYNIQNNSTAETEWEYSHGLSLGLTAALGAEKKVNDRFSVFGEFGMINQSWAPKKGKMTKYSIDGIDQLQNMTPYQKETDFFNNYTTTNNNPTAAWSHRQQLKQYFPFSSIGINIGIHYSFGKV